MDKYQNRYENPKSSPAETAKIILWDFIVFLNRLLFNSSIVIIRKMTVRAPHTEENRLILKATLPTGRKLNNFPRIV